MRLPLQMFEPSAAQKRQIASCTKRGNTFGPPIKGAGVDLGCGRPNDLGTAAMAIAARAIAVRSAAILEDAGAMQKVMDQRIDGNHAFAGLEPMRSVV